MLRFPVEIFVSYLFPLTFAVLHIKIMPKIEKLCKRVLEFTKEHQMRISEKKFREICGEQTDAVLAELKHQKYGTFVSGCRSIWSINRDTLEHALTYYQELCSEKKATKWKWIIGIVIPIIGIIIGLFS